MTALVLADEVLRKFGGDSVRRARAQPPTPTRRRSATPRPASPAAARSTTSAAQLGRGPGLRRSTPTTDPGTGPAVSRPGAPSGHVVLVGMMGAGKTTVGRLAGRARSAARSSTATSWSRPAPAAPSRELFEADGRGRRSGAEESAVLADALAAADAGGHRRRRRARCSTRPTAACMRRGRRRPWSWLRADPGGAGRPGAPAATHRPLLDDDPAARSARLAERARAALRRGRRRASSTSTAADARPSVVRRRSSAVAVEPREARGVIVVPVAAGRPVLRRARRRRRAPRAGRRRAAAAARRAAIVTQAGIGVEVDPGVEHRIFLIGDGEEAKTPGHRRGPVPAVGPVGPHPGRRRRGRRRRHGHRRRRVRRRRLPPGRRRRARVDHAARPDRRRHRRQDRREPARGQEPGRRLLAAARRCSATPRCWPRCRPASCRSGLGELAKYHFLGGGDLDALPARRAGRRAACASRPTSWPATSARAAAGPRSTTATPWRHALEIAGALRPAPRRGGGHRPRLRRPSWPTCLGRIDDDAGGRAPARWSAATTCPSTLPAGLDPDELVALFGRDKKAIDGVTFVLDGPDGVEPVTGVRAAGHRRRRSRP